MIPAIKRYCDELVHSFDTISNERKLILQKISEFIKHKQQLNQEAHLVYICTHNSRRSHFGQIWAAVAANYYGIKLVNSFSGGTEETTFNTNAIEALRKIGFEISSQNDSKNPVYEVKYDTEKAPLLCFSKIFSHPQNPQTNFAAIMTCSEAEQNCPFIPGAELRCSTTYEDPKIYDNSPEKENKYNERCKQIALESLYVFSQL